MSITIKKVNSDIDHYLDTPKYGKALKIESINLANVTYFDSYDNYKLYITNEADKIYALKEEEISRQDMINKDIEKIKSKYAVETVKYIDSDNTIIVKVNEGSENTLDSIISDFSNNSDYVLNKVTNTVLFLDLTDTNEIQLDEDDDLLNHLDDNTIKDIASKTGTKLSGSESKDELKGIIKGAINSSK